MVLLFLLLTVLPPSRRAWHLVGAPSVLIDLNPHYDTLSCLSARTGLNWDLEWCQASALDIAVP